VGARERIAAVAAAQAAVVRAADVELAAKLKREGRLAESWRALGLECAFDPAKVEAAFAPELLHLDAERLLWSFPRDDDGRLPLKEVVLLVQVPTTQGLGRKQRWLAAISPNARREPQRVTLVMVERVGSETSHVWDEARWLWDDRARGASAAERWGVASPPAATMKALLDDGDWLAALKLHGVKTSWDAGDRRDARNAEAGEIFQRCAPWRLAKADGRLFNFRGQTSVRKEGVAVTSGGLLFLDVSGSLQRVRETRWMLPRELELLHFGFPAWPDEVERGAKRRAEAGSDARSREQLWAAVLAAPADDAPRRVLSDWLLEQGDARGEVIQLQLLSAAGKATAAQQKRERKLHKEPHAWLGPLGDLVQSKGLVLERGLIHACTLGSPSTPADAWERALGSPELALARELVLADAFPPELAVKLLESATAPLLDALTVASAAAMLALAKRERPVRKVTYRMPAALLAVKARPLDPRTSELTLGHVQRRNAQELAEAQELEDWVRAHVLPARPKVLTVDVSEDPYRQHRWVDLARALGALPDFRVDLGRGSFFRFTPELVEVRLAHKAHRHLVGSVREQLAGFAPRRRVLRLVEGEAAVHAHHDVSGLEVVIEK